MGVQKFLKGAVKTARKTFDMEDVVFAAAVSQDPVQAIVDFAAGERMVARGADELPREIVVLFELAQVVTVPRSGTFQARGQTWKIGEVQVGQVMVQVHGHEPEKRGNGQY